MVVACHFPLTFFAAPDAAGHSGSSKPQVPLLNYSICWFPLRIVALVSIPEPDLEGSTLLLRFSQALCDSWNLHMRWSMFSWLSLLSVSDTQYLCVYRYSPVVAVVLVLRG